jgi:hypothetical protein
MTSPVDHEDQGRVEVPISESTRSVNWPVGLLRPEERALSEESTRRIGAGHLPRVPAMACNCVSMVSGDADR